MTRHLLFFCVIALLDFFICACIILRPVALSTTYLAFVFASPYISTSSRAYRKTLFSFLIGISALHVSLQVIFQLHTYVISINRGTASLLADIGFVSFDKLAWFDTLLWISPDVVIFLCAAATQPLIGSIQKHQAEREESVHEVLQGFAIFASLASLCLAGAIIPSLTNGMFFAAFLIFATILGCNYKLGRKFAVSLRIISSLMMLQLLSLIIYQMDFLPKAIPQSSTTAKLLGLHRLTWSIEQFHQSSRRERFEWDSFCHPLVITMSYLITTCAANLILQNSKIRSRDEERSEGALTPEILPRVEGTEKPEKRISIYLTVTFGKLLMWTVDFILENSFIVTILSMMIWSILFHSWLSFVFLLISNIIWVLPNKRRKIIRYSPLIIVYAIALITFDYVLGMEVFPQELRRYRMDWQEVGLVKYDRYPVITIVTKSVLSVPFFITLRQKFIDIRRMNYRESVSKLHLLVSRTVKKAAIFTWMWVIAFILLVLALYDDDDPQMTLFRIANMGFFLTYVLLFQLSFKLWKSTMYTYWITLIAYAMSYLILIYVYQFENIPKLAFDTEAIGLSSYNTSELFLKLFSFTMITILVGIQLNYFHSRLLKYLTKNGDADIRPMVAHAQKRSEWRRHLKNVAQKVLLFLDMHLFGLYFVTAFWMVAKQTQILNVVIMILLAIGTMSKMKTFKSLITRLITILAMGFIFGVMLLDFLKQYIPLESKQLLSMNCSDTIDVSSKIVFVMRDVHEWFKVDEKETLLWKIGTHLELVIASTMLFALRYYHSFVKPNKQVVFEDVTGENAEESLGHLIKYYINNALDNFGIELTLVIFAATIFLRMDLLSVIYMPLFMVLVFKRRDNLKQYWLASTRLLFVSLVAQCMAVGLLILTKPCVESRKRSELEMQLEMNAYFKIVYYNVQSLYDTPMILTFDFLLLTIMSRQSLVFRRYTYDPRKSFSVERNTSYCVALLKTYTCKIQFWVTLSVIFLAATHDVDLFSLGYMTIAFAFLWQGTDFYLKPTATIINWWNAVLIYNVFVIIAKVAAKVFRCNEEICEIFDALHVPCVGEHAFTSECESFYTSDIIIFLLVLAQRRIFLSKLFTNAARDTLITSLLASRGATLTEEIRIYEVNEALEHEAKTLKIIKQRMETIRRLGAGKRSTQLLNHDLAIREGGYYMYKDEIIHDIEPPDDSALTSSVGNVSRESDFKTDIEEDEKREQPKDSDPNKAWRVSLKNTLIDVMNAALKKLRFVSKRHILIAKTLDEEMRLLKISMTQSSLLCRVKNETMTAMQQAQLTSVVEQVHERVSRPETIIYDILNPSTQTLKALAQDLLYVTSAHTDLMVFLAIFVNQVISSNILSIILPLFVFLWGTLTFPRPSKTFWVLLMAYVQITIFIKCCFKFSALWWDDTHIIANLIGMDLKHDLTVYDLALLVALFIHRIVLKKFGMWKANSGVHFNEGTFELERMDAKTKAMIHQAALESTKDTVGDVKLQNDPLESNVNVQDDREKKKSNMSVVYRHELTEDNTIKEVHKDRYELLGASEKLFIDSDGKPVFLLRQDDVRLRLRPLEPNAEEKNYNSNKIVIVEHSIEDMQYFYPRVVGRSLKKYPLLICKFLKKLHPSGHTSPRKPVDVYIYMFLCGFTNFFVLLFGFSKFAIPNPDQRNEDRSIINYIEENKVPSSLVVLLIVQFFTIIIDRIIYVRKNMLAKIVFHFVIVLTTHMWLFLILPSITKRNFNTTAPPVLFYGIRSIYLLLSAYQIRSGYPERISGNFLMKGYGTVNMICFKLFLIVPFLFELRTLIDWTFTPTSLTFSEWIRVETIFAHIFDVKCRRHINRNTPRGAKQSWFIKIIQGGGLVALIIFILWLPMLFFAYTHSLGESTLPNKLSVEVRIKSFEPLYRMSIKADSASDVYRFTDEDLKIFKHYYEKHPQASFFLEDFGAGDVSLLQISVTSSSIWNISPPSFKKLLNELDNGTVTTIDVLYEISQIGYLKDKNAKLKYRHKLTPEDITTLKTILTKNPSNSIQLKNVFPKYLHVANTGKVESIRQLYLPHTDKRNSDLIISMEESEVDRAWWRVQEACNDTIYKDINKCVLLHDCENYLNFIAFNERSFPSQLSSFAVKGIIGFYVSIVVIASRFIRNTVINSGNVSIFVEELPNVDKILNLCRNIYMVREAQDFKLEEDLVAKLIFLFRSPETLIEITRHKWL